MVKYYTRVCNFYLGKISKEKVKKKTALALNNNKSISFDTIEIITKKTKRKIHIKEVKNQNSKILQKIKKDIKIVTKKKFFKGLNFSNIPILMGVVNLTPDSFSDGGKYNKKNLGFLHARLLAKQGCEILDIGGESTRPGAKDINKITEWKRINNTLKKIKKIKKLISLDTRKSWVMEKGIKNRVNIINDVSGLSYDKNTIEILKKYNVPFIIHHSLGTPENMQKIPIMKMFFWIYMIFLKKKLSK